MQLLVFSGVFENVGGLCRSGFWSSDWNSELGFTCCGEVLKLELVWKFEQGYISVCEIARVVKLLYWE